jgi:c-di-GMP phosphodiesterase
MVRSVLGGLALGYRLLWDQRRQLAGVQLQIGIREGARVDASHLVRAVETFNFRSTLPLLLCVQATPLLADLLTQTPPQGCWLGVPELSLQDPATVRRVQGAWQRGVRLFWQGGPGGRPPGVLLPCFTRSVLTLSPQEALDCLRASLQRPLGASARGRTVGLSPVLPEQIYAEVPSGLLAGHCLDECQAWALAGWPLEEVLHGARQSRSQPDRRVLLRLLDQLGVDGFTEPLEPMVEEDPVLACRLLRFANSAAMGLRTPVASLRHALQVIGEAQLRSWLLEQLPSASTKPNLRPVRGTMAMRARLMAALLDAGDSDELRSEVLLCGLLSQTDLLLNEPLHEVLGRLPLPARVTEALLGQSGPYLALLEMATAMEQPDPQAVADHCDAHQMDPEAVNQALLHTLAQLT